jgi:hypothetical protein
MTRNTDIKFAAGTALTANYASNTLTFSHAQSGVTPGTYTSVEVDAQGHIVNGSNPAATHMEFMPASAFPSIGQSDTLYVDTTGN